MPTAPVLRVTVRAPEKLQSGSSSVDFTSLLAYRTASQRAWTLLLKGSGSRTVPNIAAEGLEFRLGGRVTTHQSTLDSRYSGTVVVSFHCGPGH